MKIEFTPQDFEEMRGTRPSENSFSEMAEIANKKLEEKIKKHGQELFSKHENSIGWDIFTHAQFHEYKGILINVHRNNSIKTTKYYKWRIKDDVGNWYTEMLYISMEGLTTNGLSTRSWDKLQKYTINADTDFIEIRGDKP